MSITTPSRTNNKKNILIIEQDHFLREIYREKLMRSGYSVEMAGDELEALESISCQLPDAILFDILPPEKKRLNTVNILGKNPQTKNIHVFLLTCQDHDTIKAMLETQNQPVEILNIYQTTPKSIEQIIKKKLRS